MRRWSAGTTTGWRTCSPRTSGFAPCGRVEALGPHGVDGRARIRYRVRLRPVWAPDTWHVIEQTGYLKVGTEGRVTRLDLSCTGYHPV